MPREPRLAEAAREAAAREEAALEAAGPGRAPVVRPPGAQGVRALGAEGSAGQPGSVWPVRVLALVASESLRELVWAGYRTVLTTDAPDRV